MFVSLTYRSLLIEDHGYKLYTYTNNRENRKGKKKRIKRKITITFSGRLWCRIEVNPNRENLTYLSMLGSEQAVQVIVALVETPIVQLVRKEGWETTRDNQTVVKERVQTPAAVNSLVVVAT